jgi:hypothetical protein
MLPTDVLNEYPDQRRERDRWILAQRGARSQLDPFKPRAFLVEEERAESGEVVSVATIFLTNRECPWRCLMCDLWKNTVTETVPVGAIPAQIDYALAELSQERSAGFARAESGGIPAVGSSHDEGYLPDSQTGIPMRHIRFESGSPSPRLRGRSPFSAAKARPSPPGEGALFPLYSQFSHILAGLRGRWPAPSQIKLYNSGSFFDPRAIPPEDYVAIAERVRAFERVIVECHPALVGESALKFRDLLSVTQVSQAGPPHSKPTPDPSQEGISAAALVASLN